MFKKLKDRIAEEVKQSPARFQDIINSAQVKVNVRRFDEQRKNRRKISPVKVSRKKQLKFS